MDMGPGHLAVCPSHSLPADLASWPPPKNALTTHSPSTRCGQLPFPATFHLKLCQRFKICCRCLSPSSRCDAVALATGTKRRKKTMKVGGRPKAREGNVTLAKSTTSQGTSVHAGVSPGLGHATPHPPAREAGEHQLDQWDRGLSGWTEPCVPGEEAKTLKMPGRLHVLQMETKPLSNIVPTKGEKGGRKRFS